MVLRTFLACVFVVTVACDAVRAPRPADALVDDFSDTVRAGASADRIVSLSPVTTEILFALGAGGRLVGRTHWDLYPDAARSVTDLGNGMQPNVEAVLGVKPDLVILYASEANRGAAKRFRAAGVNTLTLHMDHVADFRHVVVALARAVHDSAAGARLADSVERSLAAVRTAPRPASPPQVFWFIWESPLYTIGRGSFLNELVETAGAHNIFADLDAAAPQVTLEEVVRRNPQFVLTGPLNAARIRASAAWQAVPAVRAGRILVVDTTLTGRPGPRLGEAARHLRTLIFRDRVK